MENITWKNVVELAGAVAIVASLTFVGIELRQSKEIARTEIGMAALAAQIEINNSLMDSPDIWRRGSLGEELSDDDAVVFDLMAQNMQVNAFWAYVSFGRIADDIGRADQPAHNFARLLHEYPGLRKHHQLRNDETRRYRQARGLPLESETFNGKVIEILENYDAL